MNTSKNFKLKLGLFITAGFLLFFIAIFYIGKKKNLFNPTIRLQALYKNVGGLQVGNNVRFSGINVGTVDVVKILSDTSIIVEVIIDKDAQKFIKMDSYATVGSEGLMGDKTINISQGTFASKAVEDGGQLASIEPVETDAIMASLQVTSENAEIVTGQLAEILYKINVGEGTLGRLIQDTTIAENLNQTIMNLKQGTKGLNQNMEAAKSSFLLKGYFKKKKKAEENRQEEVEKNVEEKKKEAEEEKDKKEEENKKKEAD